MEQDSAMTCRSEGCSVQLALHSCDARLCKPFVEAIWTQYSDGIQPSCGVLWLGTLAWCNVHFWLDNHPFPFHVTHFSWILCFSAFFNFSACSNFWALAVLVSRDALSYSSQRHKFAHCCSSWSHFFFLGCSWSWLLVPSQCWPGGVVMGLTPLLQALVQ